MRVFYARKPSPGIMVLPLLPTQLSPAGLGIRFPARDVKIASPVKLRHR